MAVRWLRSRGTSGGGSPPQQAAVPTAPTSSPTARSTHSNGSLPPSLDLQQENEFHEARSSIDFDRVRDLESEGNGDGNGTTEEDEFHDVTVQSVSIGAATPSRHGTSTTEFFTPKVPSEISGTNGTLSRQVSSSVGSSARQRVASITQSVGAEGTSMNLLRKFSHSNTLLTPKSLDPIVLSPTTISRPDGTIAGASESPGALREANGHVVAGVSRVTPAHRKTSSQPSRSPESHKHTKRDVLGPGSKETGESWESFTSSKMKALTIHTLADSLARLFIGDTMDRIETFMDDLNYWLELDAEMCRSFDIFLHPLVSNKAGRGRSFTLPDEANTSNCGPHYDVVVCVEASKPPTGPQVEDDYEKINKAVIIYVGDTPGDELERSILKALISAHWGSASSNVDFVIDGLVGYIFLARQRGHLLTDTQATNCGLRGTESFQLMDILFRNVQGGRYGESLYNAVATSFCMYLLQIGGAIKFQELAVQIGHVIRAVNAAQMRGDGPGGQGLLRPDKAFRSVYNKPIGHLETMWRKHLQQPSSEVSMKVFVGLAQFFYHVLRPYSRSMIYITSATVFTAANTIAAWVFIRLLLDDSIPTTVKDGHGNPDGLAEKNNMYLLIWAVAAVILLGLLSAISRDWVATRVVVKVSCSVRQEIFRSMQLIRPSEFKHQDPADTVSHIMSDMLALEEALVAVLCDVCPAMVMVSIAFVGMFVVHPILGLVGWILLGLAILIESADVMNWWARKTVQRRGIQEKKLGTTLLETIRARGVIQMYNLEEYILGDVMNHVRKFRKSALGAIMVVLLMDRKGILTVACPLYLLGIVGAILLALNELSLGSLVIAMIIFVMSQRSLIGVVKGWKLWSFASQAIPRILRIMQCATDSDGTLRLLGEESPQKTVEIPFENEITLSNISLDIPKTTVALSTMGADGHSYQSRIKRKTSHKTVLREINMTIARGERIAIVGRSGSGKSCVANLLMHYDDPTTGTITIDDNDTRMFSARTVRRHIACVSASIFLFESTVMENLRVARLDAADEEVVQVARDIGIHTMIKNLPEGYDTVIGESSGIQFSVREMQLLSLARALLQNPSVILLDGVRSLLRAETNHLSIEETLDFLAKYGLDNGDEWSPMNRLHNRSIVWFTSHLTYAQSMDRVYMLDGGTFVESGSFESIYNHMGMFREMWDHQMGVTVGQDRRHAEINNSLLQSMQVFSDMLPSELEILATAFIPEQYPAGTMISRTGDEIECLYVIAVGSVAAKRRVVGYPRYTTGEAVKQTWITTGVLGVADSFGQVCLKDTYEHFSASYFAVEPCLILTLTNTRLHGLLTKRPGMLQKFHKSFEARVKRLEQARNYTTVEGRATIVKSRSMNELRNSSPLASPRRMGSPVEMGVRGRWGAINAYPGLTGLEQAPR